MREKCYWVKQSWSEMPPVLMLAGKKMLNIKWRLKAFPGLLCSTNKIIDYDNNYSRVYFNLNDWAELYSQENISFAFGTHFHGNMVAMHNGIPALWVTHDSRTKELTDFLHLPSIPLKIINNTKYVEELFKYCNYDETKKHYSRLCRNYIGFLEENGIAHLYNIK